MADVHIWDRDTERYTGIQGCKYLAYCGALADREHIVSSPSVLGPKAARLCASCVLIIFSDKVSQ